MTDGTNGGWLGPYLRRQEVINELLRQAVEAAKTEKRQEDE